MLIFQFHCISHEGTMFDFHGQEFLCLCFGLESALRIFTKLLKIPISVLRRICIRIVIYLDDMLIMGQMMEEILISTDTVIFLIFIYIYKFVL